jgi:uncharacterized protein YndB with AHSA1/START domain
MGREFEIRKEVELSATPEQVWQAIATGPGLAAWFMPMEIDADGPGVTAWEPGRRLAIRTPAAEDGTTQAFEYLIEALDGGSTVLRFAHSGFLGDDWSDEYEGMTGMGWDMYLHTLGQYLRHFPGRRAAFVLAEGPASTTDRASWPVLLRALGVPEGVVQGEEVRLTPAGIGPIDGVADYVTAHFLGVRSDNALYRFHGRYPLGMPIAVGHHLYADGVDTGQVGKAWQSWLDGVFGAASPEGTA